MLVLRARAQPGNELVAQLPADEAPGAAAMLHYTWGTVFKDAGGAKVWEFDKRVYTEEKLQRIVRAPSATFLVWHDHLSTAHAKVTHVQGSIGSI